MNQPANTAPIKRIGLLRLSALGDLICVIPLLRTLQKTYPDAQITWITSSLGAALLKPLDNVRLVIVPKPKSLKKWWQAKKILQHEQFDVLLVLQASLSANLLCPLINAPRKIGFDTTRGREGHNWFITESIDYADEHFIDAYMRFAKQLDTSTTPTITWDIPIDPSDSAWAKEQLKDYPRWLAINLIASKQERCWSSERHIHIINYCHKKGIGVVLIGSNSQRENILSTEVAKRCQIAPLNLCGKTNLQQLIALISQVDALLAPDTGPVHIARAVSTTVIGLYAVATPALTGPYQQQQYCIDRYPNALAQYLSKKKTAHFHTRVHDPRAMRLISTDDVIAKINQVFSLD